MNAMHRATARILRGREKGAGMKRVMGFMMVLGLALACEPDKAGTSTTVTTNTKTESKTVSGGKTT